MSKSKWHVKLDRGDIKNEWLWEVALKKHDDKRMFIVRYRKSQTKNPKKISAMLSIDIFW